MTLATILTQIVITLAVVGLYHLWISRPKPPAPAPAAPVAAQPSQPLPAVEQVPPEILAVIAAAVAVVIDRPHRVLAVENAARAPEVNVWALEGRVEQFLSHKIR